MLEYGVSESKKLGDILNNKDTRKVKSNKLGQDDFIKLFIEQLKRQNPLEPLKDKEFISQISQFSSLEQVTKLNSNMEKLIHKNSNIEFLGLLGKRVHFIDQESSQKKEGIVTSLERKNDQFYIKVDNRFSIDYNSIIRVKRG